MPQIKSAKKRIRTQARQTAENRLHRARSRTALKKVRELAASGNVTQAVAEIATVQTYLDKAAKTGAWHPNTAARYKSRLAATLKKAGNSAPAPARVKTPAAKPASKKPAAKAAPKAGAGSKAKAGAKPTKSPATATAKPAARKPAAPKAS